MAIQYRTKQTTETDESEEFYSKLSEDEDLKDTTKTETVSSIQLRVNDELLVLESHMNDLRGRLFGEGEAKEGGKEKKKYSSIESMVWESFRKVQQLNKIMKSVLTKL